MVGDGVCDDVIQHRVGWSGIRAGAHGPHKPIEADLCQFVDVVLSAVCQEELSGDVFRAVDGLGGGEPQVDDVV